MKRYFFAFILLFIASYNIHAKNVSELLLPINITSNPEVHLHIKAPDNFSPIQSLEEVMSHEIILLEYIPKNETKTNWSHILTGNLYVNVQKSASALVAYIEQSVSSTNDNFKILEKNIIEHETYQEVHFAISYKNIRNNRRELLFVKYYSGPYDLAGVQYTMVIPKNLSDKNALIQAKAFLKKHTRLIARIK